MESPNSAAATSPAQPASQVSCPLCGGPVYDLRGLLRCGRCAFTFCDGCCGTEAWMTLDD